jgi:uncharacterized membrane protein
LLAEFDRVQPGLADRIVKMAEGEQRNSHTNQKRNFWGPYSLELAGMLIAATIVIGGLIAGYRLIQQDRELGGYSAWIAAITTLVTTAFYRRKKG